jgi:hypothetical protein
MQHAIFIIHGATPGTTFKGLLEGARSYDSARCVIRNEAEMRSWWLSRRLVTWRPTTNMRYGGAVYRLEADFAAWRGREVHSAQPTEGPQWELP